MYSHHQHAGRRGQWQRRIAVCQEARLLPQEGLVLPQLSRRPEPSQGLILVVSGSA